MQRLPQYLKRPIIDTEKTKTVRRILKTKCLNTVCEGARCPNKSECYSNNTATFLIMGNVCTRNCRYCNISAARPEPLDLDEPKHIAEAIKELGLKYAVITSVTRDDLPDGGAQHFANCIYEIRKVSDAKIEILTPDFQGKQEALDIIIEANPDVFNHNIETVKALFKKVRPQGSYERSIDVLRYIKENSNIITKSGMMVGLGEGVGVGVNVGAGRSSLQDRSTYIEAGRSELQAQREFQPGMTVEETLLDLKAAGVDIVTIGQYIQPSKAHLEVAKYYTLEEFEDLRNLAKKIGIKSYQIDPLVRSSYKAAKSWQDVKN